MYLRTEAAAQYCMSASCRKGQRVSPVPPARFEAAAGHDTQLSDEQRSSPHAVEVSAISFRNADA
jgi:hypothetical protein